MRKSILLLFAVALLCGAATPDEKKATIAYLQGLQDEKTGGFRPGAEGPPGLRATSSAIRGLRYAGGEPRHHDATIKFVASCFDKKAGGFSDLPGGKADVFTTAVGLIALVELKMPLEPYLDPAVKFLGQNVKSLEDIRIAAAGLERVSQRPKQADAWLAQVKKARNPDGTFGKGPGLARETGSLVVALVRLSGPDVQLEAGDSAIKAMSVGQRADGGFGKEGAEESDLETSYRVTRAFVTLKQKPDVEKLRGFVGKCRNADGGYAFSPGKPSTAGSTYFALFILHCLEQK